MRFPSADEQLIKGFAPSFPVFTNARYRDYTSLSRYFANEPGWELSLRLSLDFEFAVPNERAKR